MSFKRLILILLTLLAIAQVGWDLVNSWNRPQFQSQLELYNANLLLQASEYQGDDFSRQAIRQTDPIKTALTQYQTTRQSAQTNLNALRSRLNSGKNPSGKGDTDSLRASTQKLERLIPELDIKEGLLLMARGEIAAAQERWGNAQGQTTVAPLSEVAYVLGGLWEEPPRILPDAEILLKKQLDGWFEYRSLLRLYSLQKRGPAAKALQANQQVAARSAITSLSSVTGGPILLGLIGVGLLLFCGIQWLIARKEALLALLPIHAWTVPWTGETVWEVLIFGFFMVGQLLLPFAAGLLQTQLKFSPSQLGVQGLAWYSLITYLLLAGGSLVVLFWAIQQFLPLPEGWFRVSPRGRWFLWGMGGYMAAIPLVVAVSAVNNLIWQGKGGSNPLLPIALESRDHVAMGLFFGTAAIAAPLFEEFLFRGFLLPSLTKYLPVWGAIGLSSFIFAVAHLSLSEVLPLMTLGLVLGFVYVRSRNLLASMLLHSLWNSGTLISLYVLGNAGRI